MRRTQALLPPVMLTQSKKSKSLTVIHVNARSLFRHFDNLTFLASAECPHIIAISETWLDSSITNNEIRLTGYNLFRFNRNHSGGGVAVYCSDRLLCSLLSYGTFSTGVEFLWVSVRVGYFHPFLTFGCFYRPPVALSQSVHHIHDNVESMMLNNQHILACGDFNIDMFDLNKPLSQTFHHFITSHSLTQPISSPTRYGTSTATIVNLFLTTPDIPITRSSVLQHSLSDHLPICLQIKCAVPSPPPSLVTHRSFKHFSKCSFEDDLSCVPRPILDVFDDPDSDAPLKTIRVRKKSSPWITKTIRKEMDRHDRLLRFYRCNPPTGARDISKAQRNRVVWLQRKAKVEYFHQLLYKKSHPSHIWNTLKLATASSVPPEN